MSPATGVANRRPRAALSRRVRSVRHALLKSPRFQALATAFPLTRPLARRNASGLFALCTGFVHSQVLLACVRLSLFDHVRSGPRSVEDLSALTGLPVDGTDRLARAAASLKLLTREDDGRYGLGDLGAALLGNPSVFAMVRHHGDFYQDLADPVALLRGRSRETRLARFWGYAGAEDPVAETRADAGAYSDLMADTQAFIAGEVLAAYPVGQHRRLVDLGGGSGTFALAAAKAAPDLDVTVCDLPAVAALAGARLQAAGLDGRARAVGSNFFDDPLPDGADLMTLVRILHDHDDTPVQHLLIRVRAALAPGGTLLIAEPMAGTRGAEAMGESYFGLYLWAMGSGRPRTCAELEALLREAGFTEIRERRTRLPLLVRVLAAS